MSPDELRSALQRIVQNYGGAPPANNRILDMFAGSGGMTQFYPLLGYDVTAVDPKIPPFHDIRTFSPPPGEKCYMAFGAPVCDAYSASGARWWPGKDASGVTASRDELARNMFRVIEEANPERTLIENPIGRFRTRFPQVGVPFFQGTPTDFGDVFTKLTQYFGTGSPPVPTTPGAQPPPGYKDFLHRMSGRMPKDTRKALRAITSPAQAFAVTLANNNLPPETMAALLELQGKIPQETWIALWNETADRVRDPRTKKLREAYIPPPGVEAPRSAAETFELFEPPEEAVLRPQKGTYMGAMGAGEAQKLYDRAEAGARRMGRNLQEGYRTYRNQARFAPTASVLASDMPEVYAAGRSLMDSIASSRLGRGLGTLGCVLNTAAEVTLPVHVVGMYAEMGLDAMRDREKEEDFLQNQGHYLRALDRGWASPTPAGDVQKPRPWQGLVGHETDEAPDYGVDTGLRPAFGAFQ